ncbi:MAG: 4-(cytidine 5'-diphospho)-2-C-methyl-D-erythritol kinase [Agriterribacter sp.]
MVLFPNCKINIGLNITSKRNDGFHNLETIFYPVQWTDVLEVIGAPETASTCLHISGITIAGDATDNICIKAYQLLKKDFPQLPQIDIFLYKAIPTGAGLGGGSADGAFMLRLLNEKYNLALTEAQLIAYGLQLGSDCPFFILNKPCFAAGRGEELVPVRLNLSGYTIVLVNPGLHVNTGWAYSGITPSVPVKSVKEIIQQPIETWKHEIKNDFEVPVFREYPEIGAVKQKLYENGAVYAAMSGSGSTVYGIFLSTSVPGLSWPAYYMHKIISV